MLMYSAISDAATISLAPDTTWIPTKDNTCDVTVSLTGAAGNSHVTFQLISTNWPGYCMNKGARSDKSPDLQFVLANQPSTASAPTSVALTRELIGGGTQGKTIAVKWGNTATTSFTLKLNAYDYGVIGKLNAGLYKGADGSGNPQCVDTHTMVPYATGNSDYIAAAQKSQDGWSGWNGTE